MKKQILILLLFCAAIANAQNPAKFINGIDTKFIRIDTLTTTQRDALSIPAAKKAIVFNQTTTQFEWWDGDSWEALGGTTLEGYSETGTQAGGDLDVQVGGNNISNIDNAALTLKSIDFNNHAVAELSAGSAAIGVYAQPPTVAVTASNGLAVENRVSISNGTASGHIRSDNLTGTRTLQLPDADGTLALESNLFSGDYNDLSNQPTIPDNADYVDLTTDQDISGVKNFTDDLKISGSNNPKLVINDTDNGYPGISFENSGSEAFKFEATGNTGFFTGRSGVKIRFYTNNTFAGIIDTNGNFGINTASPSEKLHVDGNAYITGNVDIDGSLILESNTIGNASGTYNLPTSPTSGTLALTSDLISDVNKITTDTYTLQLSDVGNVIWFNPTTSLTITIPTYTTTAFPIGTKITLLNTDASINGTFTTTGLTTYGLTSLPANSAVELIKIDTDTWFIKN